MCPKLESLFDYLDSLTGRAPLDELTARLADVDIDCDDVADCIRFATNHYWREFASGWAVVSRAGALLEERPTQPDPRSRPIVVRRARPPRRGHRDAL